ncbi:DUF3089 domain-containing protein [Nitrospirillum sp. BR 11828]|uniref:DUF3089 domain-containing protein n=1 Tax=Nitrospirillum sp. BR 11828 TaxID=3104325 RepID=UPI002ACAD37C|nr:DUF3089 domain-containing protein [Nitrospirillum sp. BR 11828]MDZ5649741.1 DUF3089 domain-containing protein [Nitrospirillum sp. BR 11828]
MNRTFRHLLLAACLAATPALGAPAFEEQTPPPAPDYALAASWAAGPAGPGASAAVPKGASPAAKDAPADVFFIHPTTFKSDSRWNQDVADGKTNAWTDASVIARQASVFNACCRVFAPRYRQASFMNDGRGGRDKALLLAYGDIERAFDYYLEHENHGRPFILAGHSQGGWMVARLLEKRIDGTPLAARMVAAYTIGMNVAEGEFGLRYKSLSVCDQPLQTGCVLQWNAVLPSTDLAAVAARSEKVFTDTYGDVPGATAVCVNPLTFDRAKPVAPEGASKGAVPGAPVEGPLKPLMRGAVAAKCDRGFLVVEPRPALDLAPLPGGVMHYHDYGLFYADVRENAKRRVAAFLKAQHGAVP